ncbi:hypothetical protein ABZP26_05745 [Pseudoalteromonas sp. SD03]|uniref:Uncharacterized protein n=1 Tax=Pseudoalteromonas sp. SD03 TaxID=3231719 RepID=A0AB39ATL7_9GAMM
MQPETKHNSATRCGDILRKARQQKDDVKTVEAWRIVLGDSSDMESFEVIRLVELLRSELKATARKLSKAGVPQNIYKPHFTKAYQATAVESVNAGWKSFKQHITNELLVCLDFSAFIIPENEAEFDQSHIDTIAELVADLRESLEISELDSELEHFVLEQISLLERGLHDLQIRGSKAVQKCYVDGLGEILENAEVIRENSSEPVVGKIKIAWGHVQSATEKAAKLNKSADTWGKIIEKGATVVDQLSKLT